MTDVFSSGSEERDVRRDVYKGKKKKIKTGGRDRIMGKVADFPDNSVLVA